MKTRYEVLDGLRGTAALAVVALHLCEVFRPTATNPLHHGYLAVDFFYMLSGFVIGHAYDERWPQMSLRQFFGQRLRRLHPLVLFGVALGCAAYVASVRWLGQPASSPLLILGNVALGLLLLPAPSLLGRDGLTFSLNGPAWSLGQEYLANLAYALVGPRLSRRRLAILVGASGAALLVMGARGGTLHLGWSWDTLWLAPVRTAFPFFAGLLLQRTGWRLRVPGGWIGLSLLLLAAFFAPQLASDGAIKANGLLDAVLVIGVFPLLISAGAAGAARGIAGRLCRLAGEISYPLYIVHYPLVRLYADWVWSRRTPPAIELAVGAALALALPLVAWAVLKLYDEPVRAWLSRRGRGVAVAPVAADPLGVAP
jgi:peptidoglycan/LPS O-acetylase OafA/YrhL